MKTYLFDTFNRYKRFTEELDAKTILCNKSWWVFNDSGEKEVYIFNTDGSLIISVSGKVTNATWKYIPANKSVIISGNNQSYMVHPAFYDNMIFALQVDGTNEYVFLIDENNLPSTNLKSLSDLVVYFAEKERQAVLAEERKRQVAIESQQQKEYEKQTDTKKTDDPPKTWQVICIFVMIFIFSSAIICGIINFFLWLNNIDTISGTTIDIISGILGLILTFWLIFSDD